MSTQCKSPTQTYTHFLFQQLKKEFDHIDKDGGGTISKDELKKFLANGKVGEISAKDMESMWSVIDIDDSGEVDFVVSPNVIIDTFCFLFRYTFIIRLNFHFHRSS